MNNIEYLGFIAGSLVAASVLPQVIKSWRTKSTKDISMYWATINLIGQALWITYGFNIGSNSLIVMSSITFVFQFSMVVLKFKHG